MDFVFVLSIKAIYLPPQIHFLVFFVRIFFFFFFFHFILVKIPQTDYTDVGGIILLFLELKYLVCVCYYILTISILHRVGTKSKEKFYKLMFRVCGIFHYLILYKQTHSHQFQFHWCVYIVRIYFTPKKYLSTALLHILLSL